MEWLFAFLSFALVVVAGVYRSYEERRNRSGFPKSRSKGRKTFMARICGTED